MIQRDLMEREHRDELGWWKLTLLPAPQDLAGAVDHLWEIESDIVPQQQKILPTGAIELMASLGDAQQLRHADGCVTRFDRSWVAGMQQRHLHILSPPRSHLVAVRLTPVGAWQLLGLPLTELNDQVLDLDAVLGRPGDDLYQCLGEQADAAARFRLLVSLLRRRIHAAPEVHCVVRHGLTRLLTTAGRIAIDSLARETGFSQRYLSMRFREQAGLGPKRLARVLRFQGLTRAIVAGDRRELGELAQDFGYYDQAHLNRDFREMADATPTQFIRAYVPDGHTVSMFTD